VITFSIIALEVERHLFKMTRLCAVQKYMQSIYKKHDNKVNNKERYLHSLNSYLESMPEHCMQDLEQLWPGTVLGWISMLMSVISSYAALTSTVLSVKKDF
jgi:hypothetical protein